MSSSKQSQAQAVVAAEDDGSLSSILQPALSSLLKQSSRKHKELRQELEAAQRRLTEEEAAIAAGTLRVKEEGRGDGYYHPLYLALETGVAKMQATALEAVSRLFAAGLLVGGSKASASLFPSKPATSLNADGRLLVNVVMDGCCECAAVKDSAVQLNVIRCVMTGVTSVSSAVHDAALLVGCIALYTVYLVPADEVCKVSAKASLTQIHQLVFARMEHFGTQLRQLETTYTAFVAFRHQQQQSASTAAAGSEAANGHMQGAASSGSGSSSSASAAAACGRCGFCVSCGNAADHYCSQSKSPVCSMRCKLLNLQLRDPVMRTNRELRTGTQRQLVLYQRDAFLLFRSLLRLSHKALPSPLDAAALDSKVCSLQLLLSVLSHAGPVFRSSPAFVNAVKVDLVNCLMRNSAASSVDLVFSLSSSIFVAIISHFKPHLHQVIGPLLDSIYLPYIASPHSSFDLRIVSLTVIAKICGDPATLVELFLNYDCDMDSYNTFQKIAAMLEKASHQQKGGAGGGGAGGGGGDEQSISRDEERQIRELALRALVSCMKVLVHWTARRAQVRQQQESSSAKQQLQQAAGAAAADKGADSDDEGGGGGGDDRSLTASPPPSSSSSSSLDKFAFARQQKDRLSNGIFKFNSKPKAGIKYLQEHGLLAASPEAVATFFHTCPGLDKTAIGEYMGDEAAFHKSVMYAYVEQMEFRGMPFDDGIRHFVSGFRLPGEAQKIDRMMEKFAEQYHRHNPGVFSSADTAYVLAYSVILLNSDAHNPQVKKRMTKDEFFKNTRGIDDGRDIDPVFLGDIYDRITTHEIKMKDSATTSANGAADIKRSASIEHTALAAAAGAPSAGAAAAGPGLGSSGLNGADGSSSSPSSPTAESVVSAMTERNSVAGSNRLFYLSSDADVDVVKPMFEILWFPALATFSMILEESDADVWIDACLDGYRLAIKVSNELELDTARLAFVSSLRKFTLLGSSKEMKSKNLAAVKVLLTISHQDGNKLKESWIDVLQCLTTDCQILTDCGFLFLHELRQRLQGGGRLRVAGYSSSRRTLQYLPLSIADLVDRVEEQPLLRFCSPPDSEAAVDLTVTCDHHMFVSLSRAAAEGGSGETQPGPYGKVFAAQLLEGRRVHQQLVDADTRIRFLAAARAGVERDGPPDSCPQPLPFARALGLDSAEQVDAYLQLYGYWTGAGWLDADRGVLGIDADRESDWEFLDGLFLRLQAVLPRREEEEEVRRQEDSGGSVQAAVVRVQSRPSSLQAALSQPVAVRQRVYAIESARWCSSHALRQEGGGGEEEAQCRSGVTAAGQAKAGGGQQRPDRFLPWVLQQLSRAQVALVLEGLSLARGGVGCSGGGGCCIHAASAHFRDELQVALLHAGFSCCFSPCEPEAASGPWCVRYSEQAAAVQPALQAVRDVQTVQGSGGARVWCVQLPADSDRLIVARRVQETRDGEVVAASRPVILGNCVSEVERLHLVGASRSDNDVFRSGADGGAAGGGAGSGGSSSSSASAGRLRESDSVNSLAIHRIDASAIDRVFTGSANLDEVAIIDFVTALRQISEVELSNAQQPRVFALQKIVEITSYNMGRIRLVWNRIWAIISEYFIQAGCHPNIAVSCFAIDSVRQLAMKFLEKDELASYQFQKQFFKPFEAIMLHNPSPDTRELIVGCLQRMIASKVHNIRSGWKAVFVVLGIAARQSTAPLVHSAFDLLCEIMDSYFALITESSSDTLDECTNCLVQFGCNELTDVAVQAIARLHTVADFLGQLVVQQQQQAAAPLGRRLSAEMKASYEPSAAATREEGLQQAEGGDKGSAAAGSSSVPPSPRPLPITPHSSSLASAGSASAAPSAAASSSGLRVWFLLLTGLSRLVGDGRLAVRNAALDALFAVLNRHGALFTAATWRHIFHGVLFPIFDDVRHAAEANRQHSLLSRDRQGSRAELQQPQQAEQQPEAARPRPLPSSSTKAAGSGASTAPAPASAATAGSLPPSAPAADSSWLQTTCYAALVTLVELFHRFQSSVSFLLPELLSLISSCIDGENDDLARIGLKCLVVLCSQCGAQLSVQSWWLVLDSVMDVLRRLQPQQLQSNDTRALLGLPALPDLQQKQSAPAKTAAKAQAEVLATAVVTPDLEAQQHTPQAQQTQAQSAPAEQQEGGDGAAAAVVLLPFSSASIGVRSRTSLLLMDALHEVVVKYFPRRPRDDDPVPAVAPSLPASQLLPAFVDPFHSPTHTKESIAAAQQRQQRAAAEQQQQASAGGASGPARHFSYEQQSASAELELTSSLSPSSSSSVSVQREVDRRVLGCLTAAQFFFCLDILQESLSFTHRFNADLQLRQRLYRAGLVLFDAANRLPQLFAAEAHATKVTVLLLFLLYKQGLSLQLTDETRQPPSFLAREPSGAAAASTAAPPRLQLSAQALSPSFSPSSSALLALQAADRLDFDRSCWEAEQRLFALIAVCFQQYAQRVRSGQLSALENSDSVLQAFIDAYAALPPASFDRHAADVLPHVADLIQLAQTHELRGSVRLFFKLIVSRFLLQPPSSSGQ